MMDRPTWIFFGVGTSGALGLVIDAATGRWLFGLAAAIVLFSIEIAIAAAAGQLSDPGPALEPLPPPPPRPRAAEPPPSFVNFTGDDPPGR